MRPSSPRNHTHARRPVAAHPDFLAFWADGHARKPSGSRLYFCARDSRVFLLPPEMEGESAIPIEAPRESGEERERRPR